MKINVDNYMFSKAGLKKDKKFLSFSDIHYGVLQQLFYKGYMQDYFANMIQFREGCDGVLIPGDLLFWLKKYQDTEYLKALSRDLKDLSYNLRVPIFISYGNHDLPFKSNSFDESEREYWSLKNYLNDRYNGVYVLENEQIRFGDTVITGFSPSRNVYDTTIKEGEALELCYEAFKECGFVFNSDSVNIMLCHNNKFLASLGATQFYGDLYKDLSLIIGGHWHDGYLPFWFQSIFHDVLKDNGLCELTMPPVIDMCRGMFKVSKNGVSEVFLPNDSSVISLAEDEVSSVVNRSVAKYSWFLPSKPSLTCVEIVNDSNVLKLNK